MLAKKDGLATKEYGELPKSVDPYVSEWGNPMEVTFHYSVVSEVAAESKRGEVKHLSTLRKINQSRFP